MGLLDNLSFPNPEDPKTALLLSLGLGLLSGSGKTSRNFGADLGNAGLLGLNAYGQAQQGLLSRQSEAQHNQLQALQLEQAKRAAQDAQAQRELATSSFAPGAAPTVPNDESGNPMPRVGAGGGLSQYIQGLQQFAPERALALQSQLAQLSAKNLQKVGPGETLYDVGTGKAAFSAAPNPHFVDVGDSVIPINPQTGQPIGPPIKKTMSPDAQASNALGRARLEYEQSQGNKPQVVTGPNGEIFSVDARSNTGAPVMGPDGQPLSKGQKPLTEVQGNATAFAMRAQQSHDLLNQIEGAGFNPASLDPRNLAAGHKWLNLVAPEAAQQYNAAKQNFVTAVLRKESGAAISQSEFDKEDQKYFPQPGDAKSVVEQKRRARELAIKTLAIQAGPGSKNLSGGWSIKPLE